MANIAKLPSEIVFQILRLLPPSSLALVSAVSKHFQGHANDDLLWELLVRENVDSSQHPLALPPSIRTWRELYKKHHPYWFIVRHKLWHSDSGLQGKILITHYEATSGSILAYAVFGRDRVPSPSLWQNVATFENATIMSLFRPEIQVWTEEPLVNLNLNSNSAGHRLQDEVVLPMIRDAQARLSLCITMPLHRQHKSQSLWPPWTLPAVDRVRNESRSGFSSKEQRPRLLSEVSDRAFRIRTWTEMTRALPILNRRMGQHVTTWSALFRETYTPSKQKPWQGIWIGDYSTHGCEFLLIMQKRTLPRQRRIDVEESESGLPPGYQFEEQEPERSEDASARCEGGDATDGPQPDIFNRLEAIKLTGDPNIPRGQCTWLAEDISAGARQVPATDDVFGGSTVVDSHIHIADSGFKNDRYTSSEIILKDCDHIYQHWVAFNHISSYERVDLEDLVL